MKRRSFLTGLIAGPVALKAASFLPVALEQTPQVVTKNLARTEYANNEWRVYDTNGVLRIRMGTFI